MNRIIINFDICKNKKISVGEFLYLLSLYINDRIDNDTTKKCLDRCFLFHSNKQEKDHIELSIDGVNIVEDVISSSEALDNGYSEKRVLNLAEKLKELYPKGKKPESNIYWTDGVQLIARRLKIFFKKYGIFEEEIIIEATKKYVEDYKNNLKYMKLLKYFIFKESTGVGGEVEPTSDLLNYIENRNQESDFGTSNPDWINELR